MLIRKQLTDRARDFNIILDDVAITELSFGKEYAAAVESKQVAQQEAQRAAFVVDKAKQERQQKIVQAEGEAAAAAMLGESIGRNPGYLKLRKLRASSNIARTVRTFRLDAWPFLKLFLLSLDFSVAEQSLLERWNLDAQHQRRRL